MGNMLTHQDASAIILHAVHVTEPRWRLWDEHWANIDRVFLCRAYEQGGFELFKFVPKVLDPVGLGTIAAIGRILAEHSGPKQAYDRTFAGSLDSPFFVALAAGDYGNSGREFAIAVRRFLTERLGKPGGFFWRQLWHMLISCAYLVRHSSGSFAEHLRLQLAAYYKRQAVSDSDILGMSSEEWQTFVLRAKPYRTLRGVGPNVFDFLMGDIIEARFARDCFKLDSANEHFFRVTGISDLIGPVNREHVTAFLRSLNLGYSLRETNRGMYAYCSKTEAALFGFCHSAADCRRCGIAEPCLKRLQ